jgi:hypothetical protein
MDFELRITENYESFGGKHTALELISHTSANEELEETNNIVRFPIPYNVQFKFYRQCGF